jgi:hypothetical protein
VGARPGTPVKFDPQYEPAKGTRIDIDVEWTDSDGKKHTVPAQQMIKQIKTGKAMSYHWVFAGSAFWTDEQTGKRYYYADGGELVCVSNFATAMLDLPVQSSESNEGLLFMAFTENIPPLGTKVRLILKPERGAESPESRVEKGK